MSVLNVKNAAVDRWKTTHRAFTAKKKRMTAPPKMKYASIKQTTHMSFDA